MGKFDLYKVELKNLSPGVHEYEYFLENKFFVDIDGDEVQKGKVKVNLTVKRSSMVFDMNFQLEGVVYVPCDRCLDDMNQSIQYKEKLQVKFGESFSEEGDIVIVPESDGAINIAWFLYEFIVLNIPIKHVHVTGECNKTMVSKLKKHITRQKNVDDDEAEDISFDDDEDISVEDTATDPRWDGLQNILENN